MKNKHLLALSAAFIIAFSGSDFTALAEKYPLHITAEAKGEIAEIHISGVIHEWQNSAHAFKVAINEILAQGIEDVHLYINSPGGNVFEANEIANEIERFPGTIKGFGGAIVASAAGYLALICDTFEMAENGQFMYHKPMGAVHGNEDKVQTQLKALQNMTAQYRKKYSEKTGIAETTIEANWSKGDVWLSAQEALDQNFITGITKKKAPISKEQKALFVACGAPKPPRVNIKPENKMNMKILAQTLGLPEDATEEQINAKVLENKAAADKQATFEASAKESEKNLAKAKAKEARDAAVLAKKINAKQALDMQAWSESDLAGFEAYIASLEPLNQVTKHIKPTGGTVVNKDFEAMTEAEQQALADEDPEAFAKVYEAYLSK